MVRKHRAPKGALRLRIRERIDELSCVGQKAPSTKRCIKTRTLWRSRVRDHPSQKAPSAKRCIKTREAVPGAVLMSARQKAPSAKRCIKTGPFSRLDIFPGCASESSDHTKISHVIPYRNIADRGQKPRNINDPPSNIERSDRELRATFSNNPAR